MNGENVTVVRTKPQSRLKERNSKGSKLLLMRSEILRFIFEKMKGERKRKSPMEKKTTRMADGDWKSAGVRKTMREVEFSNWVDEFMAKERATSSIDYSKPAKLTRPFVVRNVIDDDLNLILPPFEPKNQEKEKEKEKEKKEPDYSKDELNNKINDALLKRKMLAQDEKQLLSQLKRVRARAAEIDNEYRHYQEKLAMIN